MSESFNASDGTHLRDEHQALILFQCRGHSTLALGRVLESAVELSEPRVALADVDKALAVGAVHDEMRRGNPVGAVRREERRHGRKRLLVLRADEGAQRAHRAIVPPVSPRLEELGKVGKRSLSRTMVLRVLVSPTNMHRDAAAVATHAQLPPTPPPSTQLPATTRSTRQRQRRSAGRGSLHIRDERSSKGGRLSIRPE